LASGRCLPGGPGRDPARCSQADAARAALPPYAARAAQPPTPAGFAIPVSRYKPSFYSLHPARRWARALGTAAHPERGSGPRGRTLPSSAWANACWRLVRRSRPLGATRTCDGPTQQMADATVRRGCMNRPSAPSVIQALAMCAGCRLPGRRSLTCLSWVMVTRRTGCPGPGLPRPHGRLPRCK